MNHNRTPRLMHRAALVRRAATAMLFASAWLVFLAAPAVAQEAHAAHPPTEFTGDWRIGFDSGRGLAEWDFHVSVDGGEISGDATHPDLSGYRFKVEGRQTGNEISFILYIDIPAHEDELYFSGQIAGDEAEGQVLVREQTYLWSAARLEGR